MKRLITSVILLCSASVLSSCSDDPVTPSGSGQIEKLYPLAIGDSWVMEETSRNDKGIPIEIDTVTTTVDSSGTFIGHSGFYLSSFNHRTQKSSPPTFHYYSINDAKSSPVPVDPSSVSYFIRYPSPVNEEIKIYDTTISNGEYAKIAVKLIAEDKVVIVPAGKFSCVVYQVYIVWGHDGVTDTTGKIKLSYSTGMGLVQREDFTTTISGGSYLGQLSRLISRTRN